MISTAVLHSLIDDKSHLKQLRVLLDHLTGEETDLERFFQLSPNLLCIVDKLGNIKKCNLTCFHLLGYSALEMHSLNVMRLVHEKDIRKTIKIGKVLKNHSITRFVNRCLHKKGFYLYLDWSVTVWVDGVCYASARPLNQTCVVCLKPERIGYLNAEYQCSACFLKKGT